MTLLVADSRSLELAACQLATVFWGSLLEIVSFYVVLVDEWKTWHFTGILRFAVYGVLLGMEDGRAQEQVETTRNGKRRCLVRNWQIKLQRTSRAELP